MTRLKIGQRVINPDLATCIEDIPAPRGSGKGRGKSNGSERSGGIRVIFEIVMVIVKDPLPSAPPRESASC
jgi:hypothetical protein